MKMQLTLIKILASFWVFVLGLLTLPPKAPASEPWLDFTIATTDIVTRNGGKKASETRQSLPNQNLTAAKLFTTVKSPGSIAVGLAEGNMTITGEATALYKGHIDPGNHVVNRGFCSWNRAKTISVTEADRRCLAALQKQSAAVEQMLKEQGIDPQNDVEALVNGADLWNQSNRAGQDFALRYQKALEQGLTGQEAAIAARVESFRTESGILSATGLFGICIREPYYQQKLRGLKPYSEIWRWECIAIDQGRRVRAVSKALAENMGNITQNSEAVVQIPKPIDSIPETLSFEVDLDRDAIATSTEQIEKNAATNSTVPREIVLDFSGGIPTTPLYETSETEIAKPEEPSPVSDRTDSSLDFSQNQGDTVSSDSDEGGLDFRGKIPKGSDRAEIEQKKIFSGREITKRGAISECTITDYRRFRQIHPVPGVSARWHNGVDVACPQGTHTVYSPISGTLTILPPSESGGGGLVARIESDRGWFIQNMHMLEITAKPGKIKAGDKIGTGGAPKGHVNAGVGTGPHSHYERFQILDGKRHYVDPTESEIKALLGVTP